MKIRHHLIALLAAFSVLAGCGTVQEKVDVRHQANTETIQARSAEVITQNATHNVSRMQRSSGAWLGMRATPLQADSSLPQIFRQQVSFRFPGRVSISTIAERITKVTSIPVSVKPDVFMASSSFVTGGGNSTASAGSVPVTVGPPLPALPGPGTGAGSLSAGLSSSSIQNNTTDLEMNYEGTLSGYLDLLAARAGISWEYREGMISLHRLVTKVFTLKALPGTTTFDSSIGKTATTNSGTNGSTSGFNSTSNIAMNSKFGVWTAVEASIKSMLSPAGKMAMSEASGNITVTDTRDVVDQVGRLLDSENATLTRQVAMRVEVLSVRLNSGNEYGIDWDGVFNQLAGSYMLRFQSPASLVTAAAGSLGVSVVAPVSGGSTTQQRYGGTQAFFKALNSYGKVSVVTTANALTLNRQPVPVAITNQVGYLAEITPAPAGAAGGAGGTPGLKAGTVTTGFLLNLLPTVLDSNSILLQFSVGISDLNRINTVSSGVGANQQSIQTPEISGTEFLQKVAMRPGETLVLSGYERSVGQYDRRTLAEGAPVGLGGSFAGTNNREAVIILVTPVLSESAI